ncbi:MAG: DNA mismatch repair endonuclease MutL [Desulfobacula sp.]|nr:DNA mismatch repair endonuclease MutL [Desulfobacula sp.]
MTIIRILPEILSNQIAAGEVVERPSSVVKELIENSIDAGATSITIEIERGGKSLIRVSDNGIGLCRDDALLSIERYATSKIFSKEDLFSISTMGFRGEALPSIASISRFTLVTRTQESNVGTKIEIAGGKIFNVSDAGAPVGTMVEVKNLFFNTPARKKFLKSDNTEVSHISDTVAGVALGNSHIRFRLMTNNRLQKSFSASDDLFQRTVRVPGKDVSKKLVPISFTDEIIQIKGYAAHPMVSRSSSSKIFFFVNNRLIHDRGLISAVFQGYKGCIMKGRFPLTVLFIRIGFDQVDVNVHPSKREVKFFNHRKVYQAVSMAVGQSFMDAQKDMASYSSSQLASPPISQSISKGDDIPQQMAESSFKVEQSVIQWPIEKKCEIPTVVQKKNLPPDSDPKIKISNETEAPKIIGQIMGTYIIAESDNGLMLIDQHAAHERIVFESLKKRHKSVRVVSQTLLVPETIELTHKESDVLTKMLDDLLLLGIEIEPFGGTTFIIKAIPDLISGVQIQSLIIDIVEKTLLDNNAFSKDNWLADCLITMACHNAIRANQALHEKEMEQLLKDLEKCENSMHCPHGRPIVVTLTKAELEKLFKRVV